MKRAHFPWFALLLILAGSALLLDRLQILHFGLNRILWAGLSLFGVFHAAQGFSTDRRGKIFWGTVVFLYGLYFLLRTFTFIGFQPHLFVSATLIILGAAFLMMYLHTPRDWSVLLPAVPLLGVGTALLIGELEYFTFREFWWSVRKYWPIVLILFGLWIIFRRPVHTRKSV